MSDTVPTDQPDSAPRRARLTDAITSKYGLFHTAVVALILSAFAQLNLWGIAAAADAQSEAIAQRLLAPFYDDTAQSEVTVFFIDDAFLDRVDESWPFPYWRHANMIRRVARNDPSVIVLDILFSRWHPSFGNEELAAKHQTDFDRLMAQLTRVSKDVPILMPIGAKRRATPDGRDPGCPSLKEELEPDWSSVLPGIREVVESSEGRIQPVISSWSGCGDRYPLRTAGSLQATAGLLAAIAHCRASTGSDGSDETQLPGCSSLLKAANDPKSVGEPMAIRWGRHLSDAQLEISNRIRTEATRCRPQGSPIQDMAHQLLLMLKGALSGGTGAGQRERCPYSDTVRANTYMFGENLRDEVSALLNGRIVVISPLVRGQATPVISPVHGQLPSAYLTAMAADNLLTMGTDYLRDAPPATAFLLEFACMFVLLLVSGGFKRLRERLTASLTGLRKLGVIFVVEISHFASLLALTLTIVWLLWTKLSLAPVNWLGLLAFITVLRGFDLVTYFERALEHTRQKQLR